MVNNQHHMIGRIVVEIETTKQTSETWVLQEALSQVLQQQALPEMERLFDQWAEPEQVVRLDQLVLDLPPMDSLQLTDEFVPLLLSKLRQALEDVGVSNVVIQSHHPTSPQPTPPAPPSHSLNQSTRESDWDVFLFFLEYGRLPWWQTETTLSRWISRWETVLQTESFWREPLRQLLATNPVSRQRWVTQLPNAFQLQLLLQLQPAWANWPTLLATTRTLLQNMDQATSTALSSLTIKYLEQQAWLILLAEIKPNTSTRSLLPTGEWLRTWLTEVAKKLSPLSQPYSSPNISANPASPKPSSLSSEDSGSTASTPGSAPMTGPVSIYQYLRHLITTCAINEQGLWLATIDNMIASASTTHNRQSSNSSESDSTAAPPSRLSPDDATDQQTEPGLSPPSASEQLDSRPSPSRPSPSRPSPSRPSPLENPSADLIPSQQTTDNQQETPQPSTQSPISSNQLPGHPLMTAPPKQTTAPILSQTETINGIYVVHGGLVLLHPFLHAYFEDVGLLENNNFRHEYAQQSAIHLLHYLATGKTDAPEYELVIPKLLCGWPLHEPVMGDIELPESALTEGENLLQTVINYWEVLKNTTIDGLQEGFLQRAGKLTRTDDWKLQIEQQSIDILLSRLPWGLSMVKLSWMSDILVVEWT